MKKKFVFVFVFGRLHCSTHWSVRRVRWKWVCCRTPGWIARKKSHREQRTELTSQCSMARWSVEFITKVVRKRKLKYRLLLETSGKVSFGLLFSYLHSRALQRRVFYSSSKSSREADVKMKHGSGPLFHNRRPDKMQARLGIQRKLQQTKSPSPCTQFRINQNVFGCTWFWDGLPGSRGPGLALWFPWAWKGYHIRIVTWSRLLFTNLFLWAQPLTLAVLWLRCSPDLVTPSNSPHLKHFFYLSYFSIDFLSLWRLNICWNLWK